SASLQESALSQESVSSQESLSSQESALSQELESSQASVSSCESTSVLQQSSSPNTFRVPFKDTTRPNLPLHSNASIKNPTLGGVRRLKKRKTTIINNYYNITADSAQILHAIRESSSTVPTQYNCKKPEDL
ncbi:13650_t:CDS:2, partial [Dentiscutata heterogama]